MKLLFGIGVLFSLVFCQKGEKVTTISVVEFATLIADSGVQCVDVRTASEYREGHIPRSINMDILDSTFVEKADSLLQKERPVALYCRSGKRSQRAARLLAERGYRVYELAKGFTAWTAAGKEVAQ